MKARQDGSTWDQLSSKATLRGHSYALYQGDAATTLKRLPSECVQSCLTSPPYWSARDYEDPRQLGLEDEVDEYVEKLVEVFREVRRVLRPDGTLWLNLGDAYFHGCGTVNGRPPERGWRRNKQLMLIPFRVALALQEDGWWLRNTVVWHKPNAMPASVRDRFTNTWEPVFLFSKAERYQFDLDPVRVPHVTDDNVERRRAERGGNEGKAKNKDELRRWLNSPRHRSTIEGLRQIRRRPNAPRATELAAYLRDALERKGRSITWVAEQLGLPFERTRHYFRVDAIGSRLPPEQTWQQLKEILDLDTIFDDAMSVEVGDNVFRNHPKGRNPGDMVVAAVAPSRDDHYAMMPEALARRCLLSSARPGDTVLDPFAGICTTGRVALAQGARFLGIDVRRDYLKAGAQSFGKITSPRRSTEAVREPMQSTLWA